MDRKHSLGHSSPKLLTAFIAIFLMCLPLLCQINDFEEEKESPVLKITEPIILDGKLEESVWEKAPKADNLIYLNKERTNPSHVETSVKILYDASHLYIGFLCFDANPSLIRGEMTIKDADIRTDDSVYVILESFYDNRHYYFFGTNIMGALLDAKISKDQLMIDVNWDGSWNSAAALMKNGWTAEISINLNDFSYVEDTDKSLGLSLSRVVPRLDTLLWSGPLDPIFNLDEPGLIKRIDLIAKLKAFHSSVYVLPGFKTGEKTGLKSAGLDATYSPHKNFSTSVTLNPDFATIEPIDERTNLTMFELNLTDKRPFFFKDTQPFDPDFNLFYPRRIGDIYAGLKFEGNSGILEFLGLGTQIQKNSESRSANFSYVRMRAQFLNNFALSLTASNKILENQNKGAAALSMEWNPSRKITFSGQFSLSYGDFSKDNSASFVKIHYDLPSFYLHLGLKRVEKHFWENANQVGYIVDDDRQEIEASLHKSFPVNAIGMNTIGYDFHYDVYWSTEDKLRSWQIDQTLSLYFREFWKLSVFHSRDYKLNALFPEGIVAHGQGIDVEDWEAYHLSLGALHYFDPDYVFNLLNPVIGRKYKLYLGSREYTTATSPK